MSLFLPVFLLFFFCLPLRSFLSTFPFLCPHLLIYLSLLSSSLTSFPPSPTFLPFSLPPFLSNSVSYQCIILQHVLRWSAENNPQPAYGFCKHEEKSMLKINSFVEKGQSNPNSVRSLFSIIIMATIIITVIIFVSHTLVLHWMCVNGFAAVI